MNDKEKQAIIEKLIKARRGWAAAVEEAEKAGLSICDAGYRKIQVSSVKDFTDVYEVDFHTEEKIHVILTANIDGMEFFSLVKI